MSGEAKVNEGNEAFMDEDYDTALECYTAALEAEPNNYNALVRRSQTYCKLGKFARAVTDAQKAIEANPENPAAYYHKAMACFENEEFGSARKAAKAGLKRKPKAKMANELELLLQKCQAEIDEEDEQSDSDSEMDFIPAQKAPVATTEAAAAAAAAAAAPSKEEPKKEEQPAAAAPAAVPAAAPAATTATGPAGSPAEGTKVRHDWVQNNDAVTITLYIKDTERKDVSVEINKKSAGVTVQMEAGREYSMEWELYGEVVPEKSTYTVLRTKIEIRLVKAQTGASWRSLTADASDPADAAFSRPVPPSEAPTSSKNGPKNWDKIVEDFEAEEPKPEGDAALDALFKQIFANGTDEQRRAMVKSYTESGGTVLSTNWDDVKNRHVDGSAPKGQVMHKWDELNH